MLYGRPMVVALDNHLTTQYDTQAFAITSYSGGV